MKLNYEVKPEEYSKVIYGDSVTAETPLIIKYTFSNKCMVDKISNLESYTYSPWVSYTGFKMFDFLSQKEYMEVGLDVYTHLGWKPIKKVIRHKTTKTIYRVYTNIGMVEVTEDHSLIDHTGKKIKPKEVKERVTRLLYDDRVFKTESFCDERAKVSTRHVYQTFSTQVDAMKFMFCLKQKGVDVRVKFINENYVVYNILDDLPKGTVLRMEKVEDYRDYVYDIETEASTFQAGIGSLIVKNTDSCMVELKTKSYEKFKAITELYKDTEHLPDDIKKK